MTLDFASLPSSQGWTYLTNTGAPEPSVYSVTGGVLVSNTMGLGLGGYAEYDRPEPITDSEPMILEIRARLLNIEGNNAGCHGYGFCFGLWTATRFYQYGVMEDRIRDNCPVQRDIVFLDTSVFHDYTVVILPTGDVRFYVDGVFQTMTTSLPLGGTPHLFLGDGTGNTNAHAEVTYYRFRQGGNVSVGPTVGNTGVPTIHVYPNPSSGDLAVEYALPKSARVTLGVFDLAGRLVRSVVDSELEAGLHRSAWDGNDQSGRRAGSGIYLVRLAPRYDSGAQATIVRRVVLAR